MGGGANYCLPPPPPKGDHRKKSFFGHIASYSY